MQGPRPAGWRARFGRFFTIVGVATTILVTLVVIALLVRCATERRIEPHTVLELDLERPLAEHAADDPLTRAFVGGDHGLDELVAALERAAADDRVDGLVARIGGVDHGMATTQEIRDAVLEFRKSGKFAIAFAETFGEVGPGNQGYYLATAFDAIWLQPSGDVGLTGLATEPLFLRGVLDNLGLDARMDHRHEYKNAKNTFTERGFTPAHREASEAIVVAMHRQMVAAIAETRQKDPKAAAAAIDAGPYLGQEAVDAGLVDRLGYRDEVMADVRARAGAAPHLLFWDKYLERAGHPHSDGPRIALIFGHGSVTRGASSVDPIFGGPTMGSDTVAGAFRAAIDDPKVKAIVFRVNSPGGSYVASDAIWRETVRAREAGKPVIVTMGDVAGSGGYFVAMHADKIVAQPGTITGSIGVLGGKVLTRPLWERIGVTFDEVHRGHNALMWSNLHDYSSQGWERFQAWLDRVYADFTQKVADGRRLPLAEVQKIARGRIWAGEDARGIGLVDELGGYSVAFRLAREAAGLAADAPFELKVYPPKKGLLGLLGDDRESSDSPAQVDATLALIRDLQPVAAELRALGLGPGAHGVLATPPIDLGP